MKRAVMGACVLVAGTWGAVATAATPTMEELWQIVQDQQRRIESLQDEVRSNEQRLQEARSRLETARQALEETANNKRVIEEQKTALADTRAMAEATAGMVESTAYADRAPGSPVSVGGYGELHYNDLDSGEEIDLHRFVLFFGHQFRDDLSFYSELEVEHSLAGDGKPGEVELEQAFVQWDYAPGHNVKGGVFLLPVGILNGVHEPDTFYGVERNRIESQVIPTTWWEGGIAFGGEIAPGWGYDLAVHSGLNLDTDSASASRRSSIRSARQKVAEANGDSLAYTARLNYTGVPGLRWSGTFQYQSDMTQGDADGIGIGKIDGTLFETNFSLERGMFGLRGLYARWDLDDRIELLNPGADEQSGWFIEPSVRLGGNVGLFARYGQYDLTAGRAATSDEHGQFDIGLNYWLDDNVVIKADFQRQDNDSGNDVDGFNLGVGYSF